MSDREQYVLRRMETCRHFDGRSRLAGGETVCKAGIKYPDGPLPCIRLLRADPPTIEQRRAQCSSLDCHSRAEAEADYDDGEAHLAKTMRVLAAIVPWRTWTRESRVSKAEVIECPECKGKLHLSQSAYNGHVHGKCETEGCVAWME